METTVNSDFFMLIKYTKIKFKQVPGACNFRWKNVWWFKLSLNSAYSCKECKTIYFNDNDQVSVGVGIKS